MGWREWVHLPQTPGRAFRAKIDTGAKTSALHAHELQIVEGPDGKMARFQIHGGHRWITAPDFPIKELREVRSSNGETELRPVIDMELQIGHNHWPIEVTLTNRADMQYDMLIGRTALAGRALVQPEKSYLVGKGPLE